MTEVLIEFKNKIIEMKSEQYRIADRLDTAGYKISELDSDENYSK